MRAALLAAVAALALLAGCGDGDGDGSGLVFKDPKGIVSVERGMEFTFEFSVNASIGYDWEQVGVPRELSLVKLTDTEVHYPNPDSIGDSGVKRFKYEAGERSGRQTLVFRRLYRGDLNERRSITIEIR